MQVTGEKVELPRVREHLEAKEISLSTAFSVWTFLSYEIRRIVLIKVEAREQWLARGWCSVSEAVFPLDLPLTAAGNLRPALFGKHTWGFWQVNTEHFLTSFCSQAPLTKPPHSRCCLLEGVLFLPFFDLCACVGGSPVVVQRGHVYLLRTCRGPLGPGLPGHKEQAQFPGKQLTAPNSSRENPAPCSFSLLPRF